MAEVSTDQPGQKLRWHQCPGAQDNLTDSGCTGADAQGLTEDAQVVSFSTDSATYWLLRLLKAFKELSHHLSQMRNFLEKCTPPSQLK